MTSFHGRLADILVCHALGILLTTVILGRRTVHRLALLRGPESGEARSLAQMDKIGKRAVCYLGRRDLSVIAL